MRRWASWQGSADHGPIRDTARTAPSSSPPPNGGKPADRWFGQNWDRSRPELDYAKIVGGPDDAAGEAVGFNGQGRVFPHPLKGKLAAPAKGYYEAVECSPFGNEMLLDGMIRFAALTESLDGIDVLSLQHRQKKEAGVDRAVGRHPGPNASAERCIEYRHRAGPAVSFGAALLGARQRELAAEIVQ